MIAPFGLQPKGTTRWRVLPLARALSERGHAVRVLIPSWDHPADAGTAWRDGSVEIVCAPFPARMGIAAWPLLLARLLREALRGSPDIVHAFKPIGFSGAVADALLRLPRTKRPLVWIDADDYEAAWARQNFVGRVVNPTPADANPVGRVVNPTPFNGLRGAMGRRMLERQERSVLARADGVSAASQQLCQLIAGWRDADPIYLPNTSSLASVGQNAILSHPETPGRTVWYTRFLDFPPEDTAGIWAEVVRLSPGARLRVVGAGLRGEEQAFAEIIAARGLSDTIALCGWLEGDALAAELRAACAAMLPFGDTPVNRYKCPARLADLTAAGIPVVAHDVGECAAYIRNGEAGLLIPPGSIVEFAQAVARLLANSEARARMRAAARERFAQQFAHDVLAARLEQAYTETVAPQRSQRE